MPQHTPATPPATTAPRRRHARKRRRLTAADRQAVLRMLELLKGGADLRARKARRTRAAIKVRSYENDLKLQVAIERMLVDLR